MGRSPSLATCGFDCTAEPRSEVYTDGGYLVGG